MFVQITLIFLHLQFYNNLHLTKPDSHGTMLMTPYHHTTNWKLWNCA
jgi:hypothetical protein